MVRIRDRIASSHLALLKFEQEEAPQVSLAPLDTRLNMHRFNALFEEEMAVEGPKNSHPSPAPPPTSASPRLSNEASAEWSAVGHAAATGKSGRVIHNLQEEVARLKRDSALWQSRAEESQRISEALKVQLQDMADWLRHKEQVHETNLKSIDRKERKIEDLRAELHAERTKRHDAQIVANETNEAMRVERQNHHRELARLQEETKHYKNQYEVLSGSMKRDKGDLNRRVDEAWNRVYSMAETQTKQIENIDRLMVIGDQKDRELEGQQERFEKVMALHENYKKTKDNEFRSTLDRSHSNNKRIDDVINELQETRDKMKWVIQMTEFQASKQDKQQPPPEPSTSS